MSNKSDVVYVWSEDDYFNTLTDAMQFVKDVAVDLDDALSFTFEVHKAGKVEHDDFISSWVLINSMQDAAMQLHGQTACDYLANLTPQQKQDLCEHIASWFDKLDDCGMCLPDGKLYDLEVTQEMLDRFNIKFD